MEDWGREMQIGMAFAHELDLYQAITAFKRAQILLPSSEAARRLQVDYEILLCYYIGKKWEDVIHTFQTSRLRFADTSFPALHDLLMILYDTYLQTDREEDAERTLLLIKTYYPDEADAFDLSTALVKGDLAVIYAIADTPPEKPDLDAFLCSYEEGRKSVRKAQLYNAILPGAGYLYLGQKQSAATAFFLNGLFITASYLFFHHDNIPAGVIFASFETGWYFGGIYGAGLEAKEFNQRHYEKLATPMMTRDRLFPILRLNYAF